MINLTVNGVQHALDIDPSTPLLYALRNDLHLHGAKFGCGLGQCGACTVIVGDRAAFSCLMPVSSIGSRPVRTIESLGSVDIPARCRSLIEHQAAQCGYCIAGMIMRAQALLERIRGRPKMSCASTWSRIFAVAAPTCASSPRSAKSRTCPHPTRRPPRLRHGDPRRHAMSVKEGYQRGTPPLHGVRRTSGELQPVPWRQGNGPGGDR